MLPARWLSFRPILFAALCTVLACSMAGCGRRGREAAKEKIRASRHEFSANDFVKAAAGGDLALVEAFLQGGIDHNAVDARGWTGAMAAAAAGHADVLKAILDDNAKADIVNQDGKTALHLAAENNQPEAVRVLIEANADVRVRDREGISPLLRAVQGGRDRVVEVFLATSRDQLARDGQIDRGLAVAAILGHTKIAGLFLDKGANVNVTVENRKTPLMLAAEYGKRETVEYLLTRKADPHLTDKDGANAAVLALGKGFGDISKLLEPKSGGNLPATVPGSATPSPAPTPAEMASASPGATPDAAAEREQAWLRQQGVKPGDVLQHDTGQDDDHDGFTNDEEIAAGTDPNDPNSHPPYYTKLKLVRVEGSTFPVVFDRLNPRTDKVTLTVNGHAGVEVEIGSRIPGVPYRVERARRRDTFEKDTGQPLDVSELTLVNTDTRQKTVLVKGMTSNNADSHATLRLAFDGSEVKVRQGEEFAVPREPAIRLTVIDIRPTQVVLKVVSSGQTCTVEK